jgi:hypothetical protein
MDLQTRKLKAIGYLIDLQEEKVFTKIEATIDSNRTQKDSKLKPFTKKQLIDRSKRSYQDYLAGRFKSQEQLELESGDW